MKGLLTTFLLENWLDEEVFDENCRAPIQRARAEFKKQTDNDVKALWQDLEGILTVWLSQQSSPRPTYQPLVHHEMVNGERTCYTGNPPPKTDWITACGVALQQRHSSLLKFIRRFHESFEFALAKTFALMLLFEASEGNERGVLRLSFAIATLDRDLLHYRDYGYRAQRQRVKGGKKSAQARRQLTAERDVLIDKSVQELLTSGRPPHQVAGIVAKKVGVTPTTVRHKIRRHGTSKQ